MNALAEATAKAGREALQGTPGPVYDGLVYGAALVLYHLRRYSSLVDAATAVRKVLDSGEALARL